MMDTTAKPRVNGELMTKYKGQVVCALGKMKNLSSNGNSFVMTLSDDVEIEVFVTEPLTEALEGMVEVIGEVGNNPQQLQCQGFLNHGDVEFSMDQYNEAVKLTHTYPEFYKVGAPAVEG